MVLLVFRFKFKYISFQIKKHQPLGPQILHRIHKINRRKIVQHKLPWCFIDVHTVCVFKCISSAWKASIHNPTFSKHVQIIYDSMVYVCMYFACVQKVCMHYIYVCMYVCMYASKNVIIYHCHTIIMYEYLWNVFTMYIHHVYLFRCMYVWNTFCSVCL